MSKKISVKNKIKNLKMEFIINDMEYFKEKWRNEGMAECQIEKIATVFPSSFRAVYTLEKKENGIIYKLQNENGNTIKLSSLNGYEKNVVIDDCFDYFMAYVANSPRKLKPCGVREIKITA